MSRCVDGVGAAAEQIQSRDVPVWPVTASVSGDWRLPSTKQEYLPSEVHWALPAKDRLEEQKERLRMNAKRLQFDLGQLADARRDAAGGQLDDRDVRPAPACEGGRGQDPPRRVPSRRAAGVLRETGSSFVRHLVA